MKSNTVPSRADPVVVFLLYRWFPPREIGVMPLSEPMVTYCRLDRKMWMGLKRFLEKKYISECRNRKAIYLSLSPCDLEIWWMTWKNKANFFHAPRNCVCHLITICGFNLELFSGNALVRAKSNHRPKTPKSEPNRRYFFSPCYLEIGWMTLKSNIASLPCF